MKSASESSSVQSAAPAPGFTRAGAVLDVDRPRAVGARQLEDEDLADLGHELRGARDVVLDAVKTSALVNWSRVSARARRRGRRGLRRRLLRGFFGSSLKSSTAAFEMTTLSRSLTFVGRRPACRPPSTSRSRASRRGTPMSAKRTLMLLKKRGSPFGQNLETTCRAAKPKVQRPCRMGCSKPKFLANVGSAWSGFQSPERR